MTRVAFLSSIDGSYYAAGVKPLFDIATIMSQSRGQTVTFNYLGNNPELILDLQSRAPSLPVTASPDVRSLLRTLNGQSPEWLITDDYAPRLALASRLSREVNRRLAVYVQLPFGLSTLGEKGYKNGPLFAVATSLPWKLLTRRYVRLLRSADLRVANSQSTAYILNNLYGVYVEGVVYPPIPTRSHGTKRRDDEKSGLFVYLGHKGDYYLRNLVNELEPLLRDNWVIRVLASSNSQRQQFEARGFETHLQVPEARLADLIALSKIAYVPTVYETFGYMGPECIAEGTPVILDVFQPWAEGFPMDTNMLTISDPRDSLRDSVKSCESAGKRPEVAAEHVRTRFSPEVCAASLLSLLYPGTK